MKDTKEPINRKSRDLVNDKSPKPYFFNATIGSEFLLMCLKSVEDVVNERILDFKDNSLECAKIMRNRSG